MKYIHTRTALLSLFVLLLAHLPVFAAKSGLTIITHGYQAEGFGFEGEEPPIWVFSMAQAISEEAGGDVPIYVVRYSSTLNEAVLDWEVTYSATNKTYTLNESDLIDIERKGSAVIILNWVLESNNFSGYSTTGLGDRFVEFLFGRGHNGHNLAEVPIHIIGHSRGASLNTRIAFDLAANGILVDQVTSLDAHPVGNDQAPNTFANTVFADSYYRTGAFPSGEVVAGASNTSLSSYVTGSSGCAEHSEVHAYYHGTADTWATSDQDGCPILTSQWFTNAGTSRDTTGYAFSRYKGPRVSRSASGLSSLIAGAGGTGTRTTVAATEQFWPNAFFDQRAFTLESATVGSPVSVPYYFADRNSQQTIVFAVDTDTNPYNDGSNSSFQQIGSVTQNARTAGSIGGGTLSWTPAANQAGLRYIQMKTTNNRADGISRVRYDYYLDPISIVAPPPPNHTISAVTPRVLNTQAAGQTQQITITGTNFTGLSRLTLDDGSTTFADRIPTFISATELRYSIGVGPTPATWTLKVVNGGVESLSYTFYVVSTGAQLTGLSVSGPATVAENGSAQYSATALFSDGSTQSNAAASWSENSSSTSISSSGQLNASSVSSDTSVTVSASYTFGGVTKSTSTSLVVVNGSGGGSPVTTNVIVNGSFEAGDNPWGPNGNADVVNLTYPRAGSWYAYVGNANSATGSLSQFFPIPAAATAATLTFYIDVVTSETTTSTKFDKMEVGLLTGSDQFVGTIAEFSNLDKGDNANGTYVLKTYNIISLLNSYKGQSLFLYFSGTTDSSNSTIFRIDDVKLEITTPSPVTLTGVSISGSSSLLEGQLEAYNARAIFSDGTTQTVSPNSWSENSSATTISGDGFLTAALVSSDTTVTITTSYTFNGVTRQGTKQVTVIDGNAPPTFASLAINGSGSINENSSQQYSATAIFSNGTTQSVAPSWSENSSKTTISGGGNLTAGEVAGDTSMTVSASHTINGVTRNASLDVLIVNSATPPSLSSLSINGSDSVSENSTAQYSATATFTDGSTQTVDPAWSETGSVTSISTFGLISAGDVSANTDVSIGASATIGGVTRSASKTVTVTDTPDTTGPGLTVTSPTNNAIINDATVTVSGTAGDGGRGSNGISSITVNGVTATGGTAIGSNVANWTAQISLTAGANSITVIAKDSFDNNTQRQITVSFEPPDLQGPTLAISQPADNTTVNASQITVSGTATDNGRGNHGIASVTANGSSATGGTATGTGTASWTAQVALSPGANTITIIANDTSTNNTGTQQQITVNYVPPGSVAFSSATYSVNEGNESIIMQLVRTGGTGGSVSVKATTVDETALNGPDYTGGAQVVEFADGVTTGSVSIPITDDLVFEVAKTFAVALSTPTGGVTLGAIASATVTINDDDQPGTLAFASGSSQAGEGAGLHTVTVNRVGGSSGAISVSYNLGVVGSGNAASSPEDFTFTAGTLDFGNNEMSKTIQLGIVQDLKIEGSEVLSLVLSVPTGGASLGAITTHTFTITDDDVFSPNAASYTGLLNDDFAASGYGGITLSRTVKGALTGKVLADGRTFSFTGKLSQTGSFTKAFKYTAAKVVVLPLLTLQLQNDGTFSGTWSTGKGQIYAITGERNGTGTAKQPIAEAGKYTAHLRGEDITPGGGSVRGYLKATVAVSGATTFVGALPDGTKLSGASRVSINGAIPVVFGLYQTKTGYLFGPAAITGTGTGRVFIGDLLWSKPPQTKGIYKTGVARASIELAGHVWTPPAAKSRLVADFDAGAGNMLVTLSEGELTADIPKAVNLTTKNIVTTLPKSAEKLVLKVTASTGLFTGSFLHSDGKTRPISGVFVQDHLGPTITEGYFPGVTLPGLIRITVPAP